MPTLDGLTALRRGGAELEAARKFVKAVLVSPSLQDLLKVKPGAIMPLMQKVVEVYGLAADVQVLSEDELDEETSKAFVEAENKGFKGLFVVEFTPPPQLHATPLRFIMRMPREHELGDAMRDAKAVGPTRALIRAICVHGPVDVVDEKFPGLWIPLGVVAGQQAGLAEEFELGEA